MKTDPNNGTMIRSCQVKVLTAYLENTFDLENELGSDQIINTILTNKDKT